MLSKLYKHEIKHYVTSLWPLYIVITASTIGGILLSFFKTSPLLDIYIPNFLFSYFFLLTPMAMLAALATFVMRFYKNLFTSQGYLTFTLPFKPMQHFWCKLIVGLIAMLLTAIFATTMFILYANSHGYLTMFLTAIGVGFEYFSIANFIFIAIAVISALFYEVFVFLTAICIGQRYKNKLTASVISYIVIDIAMGIFTVVSIFIFFYFIAGAEFQYIFDPNLIPNNPSLSIKTDISQSITIFCAIITIYNFVLLAIQYFICKNSITKHLNLD